MFSKKKLNNNFNKFIFKFNNILNEMLIHKNNKNNKIKSYIGKYNYDIKV